MSKFDMMMAQTSQGHTTQAEIYYQLGQMYALGRDVELDYVEAHKWFNLSAIHGDRRGVFQRQEMSELLSPSDILKAQRKARDFAQAH